jgi:hypothetical protein
LGMPAQLLVISENPEDLRIGKVIADSCGMGFDHANSATVARAILMDNPQTVVLWDVDHSGALEGKHPLSIRAVGQELIQEAINPSRVFTISAKPLRELPHLFNMPVFAHHITRQWDEAGPAIVSWIARACFMTEPLGIEKYLPPDTPVQRIALSRSSHRRAATEAVTKIFTTRGCPPRLVSMVAQAADELMMNALFDAPVDGTGSAYRRATPRKDDFELAGREVVTLEMGATPSYFAVSVTDHFGSLRKENVMGFIRKDYENTNYRPRVGDPGAGLGIYGMLQAGLSLLFVSKPEHATQVILFFPVVTNFKAFRTSFRFFGFMFPTGRVEASATASRR